MTSTATAGIRLWVNKTMTTNVEKRVIVDARADNILLRRFLIFLIPEIILEPGQSRKYPFKNTEQHYFGDVTAAVFF